VRLAPRGLARPAAGWAALGVALTLFFASRSVLILEMRGLRPSWGLEIAQSALQWSTFALVALPLVAAARRLTGRRAAARGAALAGLVAVASLLHAQLQGAGFDLLRSAAGPAAAAHPIESSGDLPRVASSLVLFAFLLVGDWGWRRYRELERQRREVARLAEELARERVAGLRHELQPHLLFAALREARDRLPDDPDGAESLILRFAALLRWVLDARQERFVALREEVGLVARYLEVERVRFGDRLDGRIETEPAAAPLELPAMLLQPLVELLVHAAGVRGLAPGVVSLAARAQAPGLAVEIARRGPLPADAPFDLAPQLAPFHGRLAQAYRDDARATLEHDDRDGCTRLVLRLPPSPAQAASRRSRL